MYTGPKLFNSSFTVNKDLSGSTPFTSTSTKNRVYGNVP